ncbi:hypothetical protein DH2020_044894 [Rehmannia glutinosa]|uniref:B3 domain-containing protein n=1 Tax=Rehmannia glutinosa TaxID=99300 RepID=A0ABR0UFX9_REHGL
MKRTNYYNVAPQLQDQWPIRKALTLSDVDITHPFLTLPRQQVETYIVVYMNPQQQEHLRAEGQVGINAQDDDTGDMYIMKLKWRGSYYNLIGKWGKVVRGKGLDVGQEIKLRWSNSCLHFSVPQQPIGPVPRSRAASPDDRSPINVDINHPFLTLPGKAVEDHILFYWTHQAREQLRDEHQVGINARDDDTGDVYVMKMKRTNYYNVAPQLQDQWPIRKALTLSDVDITHPFLTLPRQQVETYIVVYMNPQQQEHLRAEGQVGINAQDDDTGDMYIMKLKWRGSYYNLIGKWGKVVRGKGLDVGQEIKLRWSNSCLHFSVPQQPIGPVPPVPVPPVRMIAAPLVHNHWPIRKVLTSSDVDPNHPFLPLPRKSVEENILVHWVPQERERLRKEEHVSINARDYDTGESHEMKLKWRGIITTLSGNGGI